MINNMKVINDDMKNDFALCNSNYNENIDLNSVEVKNMEETTKTIEQDATETLRGKINDKKPVDELCPMN